MQQLDLQSLLAAVDVPADWIGIREVTETHSPRIVRDGVPEVNGRFTTQGLMVEVLAGGQFGYYGTPNMTDVGISDAAKKAYAQAKRAANHATYKFTDAARPANVGSYQSPFVKEMDTISPGELNKILLDAYTQLKVSDKIVSARAVCRPFKCYPVLLVRMAVILLRISLCWNLTFRQRQRMGLINKLVPLEV